MTVPRAEPELYWTDMSDARWQAENAPWSAAWWATLARNTECHKRALYGLGEYLGDVPHAHDTGESAHPAPCVGVNLVQASCPSVVISSHEEAREFPWRGSGWDLSVRLSYGGFVVGEDFRYVEGGIRGGWLSQALFSLGSATQARMIGGGGDMVLSFFARTAGVCSQGMLQFGIASQASQLAVSGNASSADLEVSGPGEFAPRQSSILHFTDFTTDWRRFYVPVRNAGSGLRGEMKLQLSVLQSYDELIQATGFCATQGRRLFPWAPAPGDVPQTPWGFGHAGWQNIPEDVPLMDWAVSMTDALRLEPL